MKTLAEKCKEIRERRKLAQWQLAKLIGTTQTEISFIEKGFIPPDNEKIRGIEKLYATLNV